MKLKNKILGATEGDLSSQYDKTESIILVGEIIFHVYGLSNNQPGVWWCLHVVFAVLHSTLRRIVFDYSSLVKIWSFLGKMPPRRQ